MEDKLTAAVLKVIRARRKARSAPSREHGTLPSGASGAVKLREVQFSDFEAVAELKTRWGLSPDSPENWERLWRDNPALKQGAGPYAMGWVLEADGRIVGYLGNIVLRYFFGAQTLVAATSHGFVVEPEYRASTTRLSAAFYRQPAVDIYLTTTAIEPVAKISRAFKADPLPQAGYDTVLFWVLRPYPFAKALLQRLGAGEAISRIGATFASVAITADRILHRRGPGKSANRFVVKGMSAQEIGDQFETLWKERRAEGHSLLADRSPAALRWHFDIPGDRGVVRALCCYEHDELMGYAVVRHDPSANGTQKSMVADMLVTQDRPDVVETLWRAAYESAKQAGSDVFEVLGFPNSIRRACSAWRPYQRKYPACPFYYRAANPELHTTLGDGAAWYASPFDGDTTLIRPSYSSAIKAVSIEQEGESSTTHPGIMEAEESEVGRR